MILSRWWWRSHSGRSESLAMPHSLSLPVEAAQHHRRDIVERGAVGLRLADQPQALDAGDQEASERVNVGSRGDLAARPRVRKCVAKRGFKTVEAAAYPGRRGAV